MKNLVICIALSLISSMALALELNESDIQGKWLIVKMGTMDVADMDDVWQFQDGKWTAISGGKALSPDMYTLKGNVIDVGHTKIEVLELNDKQMKTKQQGFEYTLKKQ